MDDTSKFNTSMLYYFCGTYKVLQNTESFNYCNAI